MMVALDLRFEDFWQKVNSEIFRENENLKTLQFIDVPCRQLWKQFKKTIIVKMIVVLSNFGILTIFDLIKISQNDLARFVKLSRYCAKNSHRISPWVFPYLSDSEINFQVIISSAK